MATSKLVPFCWQEVKESEVTVAVNYIEHYKTPPGSGRDKNHLAVKQAVMSEKFSFVAQ